MSSTNPQPVRAAWRTGRPLWPTRTAAGAVGALLLLAVGLATYGFSLRLPLFLDDMVHFRWLQWHDPAGIWRSARLLGYYRPVPFTVWKGLWLLQGHLDPPVLHAVNLGLHLLNALLVLGVVTLQRRQRGLWLGLGAALLFLLYPFSYQAVPWVGSLTHPLVTALILGSVLLFLMGDRDWRGAAAARVASLVLALLAPFAHETGALVAPLLMLTLLTAEERLPAREMLRRTLPYWACAGVFLIVWFLVPKSVGKPTPFNLESRWQNAFYFLQGLAYPVAPLATRLMAGVRGLNDLAAIAVVTVPAIVTWSALLWKAGRGRLVALALGWFALALAPAWLMLEFSYVVDGPRLLYEASVGAALFWAIPLDLRWPDRARRLVGAGLATLAVLIAAAGGYGFIRGRVPIYEQLRLAADRLLEARRGTGSEPLLCINYPSWLAPLRPTFALGHEGMALVPAYTGVNDFLWLHTGEEQPVAAATLPDLLRPWRFNYVCYGAVETRDSIQGKLRAAKRVIVTSYGQPDIAVYDAGGLEAVGQSRARTYLAAFDGSIALAAASGERQGSAARVEVRWQCWEPPAQETTVFLHLYDPAGRLVAQADGLPLMGTSRPALWQPGDEWRDVRVLQVPAGLAPGRYTVKVGLYPVDGGPRLAATDPAGQRFQEEAVPVMALDLP